MANELAQTDGEGGDLILTPREEAFCRNYGDPESPFYSRGAASAEAAGYAPPFHTAAWKARRRVGVIQRLEQFQDAARAAIGKVLSDLEHVRQRALEEGGAAGLAVAARCSELQGKHLGAFRDVFAVDAPAQHKYDARLEVEASRLARLALEDMGEQARLGALPVEDRKQLNGHTDKEDGA